MTDDYSHDPLDRLVRARYPPSRRTLRKTSDLSGGTPVSDVQYSFDAVGSEIEPGDAFGEPLTAPAAGNGFSFTLLRQGYGGQAGREWLSDLGLYDYRHRAYSPLFGRWLQPDPIGFAAGDANLNRYCRNAPLIFCDAHGLYTVQFGFQGSGGAGTGGGVAAGVAIGLSWSRGFELGGYASVEGGGHFGMSYGVGLERTTSHNESVSDLNGQTLSVGGSGGLAGVVGVTINVPIDGSGVAPSTTTAISYGDGGEVHTYIQKTWVSAPIVKIPNPLKEVLERLLRRLMGAQRPPSCPGVAK